MSSTPLNCYKQRWEANYILGNTLLFTKFSLEVHEKSVITENLFTSKF